MVASGSFKTKNPPDIVNSGIYIYNIITYESDAYKDIVYQSPDNPDNPYNPDSLDNPYNPDSLDTRGAPGHVAYAMEAALWAFYHSNSYSEAVYIHIEI